jgi:hypothetical protein
LFDLLLIGDLGGSWRHPSGGCEFRAEAAARILAENGGYTLKAWMFPEVDEDGRERWPLTPRRQLTDTPAHLRIWSFHVAAALVVVGADGRPAVRVFDPGLFDGPCTPERWAWALSATFGRLILTATNVFMIDPKTFAFQGCPGDDVLQQSIASQAAVLDETVPTFAAEGDDER